MGAYPQNPLAVAALALLLALPLAAPGPARAATDVGALMQTAAAARDAGNFAQAEASYRQVLALAPANTDAALLLALVIGYQGRYGEALETLQPALAREPDRSDLQVAKARLLAWSGRRDEARAVNDAVLQREPGNGDAAALDAWLDTSAPTEARPLTLTLTQSRSEFDRRSVKPWYETTLAAEYRLDPQWRVGGALSRARRYGETDEKAAASVSYRPTSSYGVALGGEVTPSADFLPRYGLGADADLTLWDGQQSGWIGPTVATLGGQYRKYNQVEVFNLDPGVVQYLADGQAWLTLQRGLIWDTAVDGMANGWSAKLDVDLQAVLPVRVYVVRAHAPENDLGVPVSTDTIGGGAIYDINDRFGLRVDYAREDRSRSFLREEWSVGTFVRF